MYSGTGVCAGHAHWQSTTLWKYSGLEMSVGCMALFYTRFLVGFSIFRRIPQAVLIKVSAQPQRRLQRPAVGGRISRQFSDISRGQVKDIPAAFRRMVPIRNDVDLPLCRGGVFL
jgi:hypothetical protein